MRWSPMILVGVASACAGPSLEVTATPAAARIYVDGRRAGTGAAAQPNTYYGTHTIAAAPPLLRDPRTDELAPPRWRATRRTVVVAEPVTPWIFPLDFAVELATLPWRRPDPTAHLELQPYEVRADEPIAGSLRERAAAARIGR